MKSLVNKFSVLATLCVSPLWASAASTHPTFNHGDISFQMVCSILVLFMAMPGLVLFYGGLVQRKNVLSTFAQCIVITAIVSVLWLLVGYSLVFGQHGFFSNFIGHFSILGINHVSFYPPSPQDLHNMLHLFFQMGFAIITLVIIIGGFAERMRFSAVLLFAPLWLLIVYCPIAHWVWGGGWLDKLNMMDFAGGTVVHINAGVAGLVAAIMLRHRRHMHSAPNSLALVTIGTSILWIGWFGFNGGNAHNMLHAILAMINTQVSAAAAALSWMMVEWIRYQRPSARGLLMGAIAGLVAITPAAGYCSPVTAIVIGLIAGAVCFGGTQLKYIIGYDDALDAFGIHGFAGIIGSILTGIVTSTVFGGLGFPHHVNLMGQLAIQLLGVLAVIIWSATWTFVILWCIQKWHGLRVSETVEMEGLDTHEHGENLPYVE